MASLGGYGRGRRPQPATNASNDALPAPGGGGGQMRPSDSGNSFNSMDGAGLGRGLPRPTRTFNNSVTQQSHSANASQPGRFNGSFNVTGITSSNPDRHDQNRTAKNDGAVTGFEPIRRNESQGYGGQLDLLDSRQNRVTRPEPTRPSGFASSGERGGFDSASKGDAGGRTAFDGHRRNQDDGRGGSEFRRGTGGGFADQGNQSKFAGGDYQSDSGRGRGGNNGFGQSNRGGDNNNRAGGGGFSNYSNRTNGGGINQNDDSGYSQSGGFGGRGNNRSNSGFSRSSESGGGGAFGNDGQQSRGGYGMRGSRGAPAGRGGFGGGGGGFGRKSDDDGGSRGGGAFERSTSNHYNGGFGGGDGGVSEQQNREFVRGRGSRSDNDVNSSRTEGPPGNLLVKPSTHVPKTLTDDELFSDDRAIAAGEHFDKMFGSMNISHKVTGLGKGVPEMRSFDEANLTDQILRNVKRANYAKPTPIQRVAIPIIAEGYDVMGCAQTGSGKTTAFMLPIINWIAKNCDVTRANADSPYAIIIGPTRELVKQLFEEGRKFAHSTGVSIAQAYGATSVRANLDELRRGCDIVVATPGRLFDFIARGSIKVNRVRFLVLDEADRMLDHGFKTEVDKFDENPDFPSKDERTTLMFSATFKPDVQILARKLLKENYAFITIGTVGAANHLVEQKIIQVNQHSKKDILIEILNADYEKSADAEGQKYMRKTLVFVERKRQADVVAAWLSMESIKATSIHGDREQAEREQAIFDVTRGDCPVLVATDVCARGLDIKGIEHVINFDLPSDKDTYVHRIGRTARVGHTGKATSFYDADKDGGLANDIIEVLTEAQQEVPKFLMDATGNSFGGGGGTDMNANGQNIASAFGGSAFGGGPADESWT